jgi:hypothetical protein
MCLYNFIYMLYPLVYKLSHSLYVFCVWCTDLRICAIKLGFKGKLSDHNWIYWIDIYIQCEAPKIANLVYKSNNYGLWHL